MSDDTREMQSTLSRPGEPVRDKQPISLTKHCKGEKWRGYSQMKRNFKYTPLSTYTFHVDFDWTKLFKGGGKVTLNTEYLMILRKLSFLQMVMWFSPPPTPYLLGYLQIKQYLGLISQFEGGGRGEDTEQEQIMVRRTTATMTAMWRFTPASPLLYRCKSKKKNKPTN